MSKQLTGPPIAGWLAAIAVAAPSLGAVPSNGSGYGIAEDSGIDQLQARFERLAPKVLRIQVPWDAGFVRAAPGGTTPGASGCDDRDHDGWCDDRATAEFRPILEHARDTGVQHVTVAIRGNDWEVYPGRNVSCAAAGEEDSGTGNCYPSPAVYRGGVTETVRKLAGLVDAWGPANEPNLSWPGPGDAGVAAGYFLALRDVKDLGDPTALLASPDFHDRSDLAPISGYVDAYWDAGGRFGDVAAFHPYYGLNKATTASQAKQTTADFSALVSDKTGIPDFPVWITEIGSYKHKSGSEHGTATQDARVSWLIGEVGALPAVQRIYYYNIGLGGDPDTGLLEPSGSPRPAWHTWCTATHGGNAAHPDCQASWSSWETLGGSLSSDPAVASWAPRQLHVFARGDDGTLVHTSFDGTRWSGWESLGGELSSAPAAVAWGPGHIDVFARGADGALVHRWFDSGVGWSAWESLGNALAPGSRPIVSSSEAGQLDVYVHGADNDLRHLSYRNGVGWRLGRTEEADQLRWYPGAFDWLPWAPLPDAATSDPAVAVWDTGRLDMFARGADGRLMHRSYE